MTIRKQLYLNSLLTVVIPTFTMLLFIALYIMIMKAALTPSEQLQTDSAQTMQQVTDLIDSHALESLADSQAERDGLISQLSNIGYQAEIRQNGEITASSLTKNVSKMIAVMLYQDDARTPNAGIWLQERNAYVYFRSVETTAGIFSIAALQSEELNSLPFIGTDTLSIFNISMLVFVFLLAIIIILFSVVIFRKQIKRITVPMNTLLEGVDRIQAGNYDTPIPALRYSEFDELAVTINRMQDGLRHSRSMQEAYDKNQAVMIAGISHDLRTPLTSIRSYVQGLKDGVAATPEKQVHYLNVIGKKADDIENLVESLYYVSNMQLDAHHYHLISVELEKFLTTTLDSVSSDFSTNQVAVHFSNQSGEKIWADLDAAEFSRAIRNVLHNSVKHNPNQSVAIDVELVFHETTASILIKDNGSGVDDSELPYLFDLFFRADPSRRNSAEGHGLGLAIVKRIVEGHHGVVAASNHAGLEIEIILPARRTETSI